MSSLNNSKISALPNLNVLNPKALERQLKIVEGHIGDLQAQINELEKMRQACLILLGTAPLSSPETPAKEDAATPETAPKKNTKKAVSLEDLSPRIIDLLKERESGMSADEIFDRLREAGVSIPGKRPVASVYATLEKHPDLFAQNESGIWVEAKSVASESMN